MDTNGSGDQHRVQAAAGRAVGGGPPPSATASASAMASSLPPPAPSATDAAVRTRARDAFFDSSDTGAGADPPVPPAQIGALLDRTDQAIKEFMKSTQDDAPVPPAQISANSEGTDAAIEGSLKTPPNAEDVPMHPSQIATDFNDADKAIEMPQIVGQEEALQQAPDPPTPAAARALSPPPTDRGRTPSSSRGQRQLPVRPPPQSMIFSPDEDADPPVSALPRDPSVPMLEATLVEDQPEIPVYDAFQVSEQTRFERNKKIIIGVGMGVLFGAAVTAGVTLSSNNSGSDSNTIDPEGAFLSTARMSESSFPSDVPSLLPTLGPSRTLAPSTGLRPNASLRPGQTLSIRPTPTPAPPLYCGEINILTDGYYYDSSWELVRFDTIGGTSYATVVLEGAPEGEGLHTYEACLEGGDYEFVIFDSCGDGIDSPGYYSLAFDGTTITRGGEFDYEEKVSFSLPLPSPQPSESSSPSQSLSPSHRPSESSSPSKSMSPSFRPSISLSPTKIPSSSLRPSPLQSSPPSTHGLGFNGEASRDNFGRALAFSADASTMAVGAPGVLGNAKGKGYVKVYHRKGEGSSWEQRGDTIRGEANGDNFGGSLALSNDGTTLSIGAPYPDSVGSHSHQVKIFKWDEAASNYVQVGDTLYGALGDWFGWSLDISNGKILAVGAPYSDANGSYSGQVTVYAWDEASSNYKQRGEAIDGGAAGDYFGISVSLAGDGQKLAVGAYGNDSNGSDSGQVRVFEWDEAAANYKQLGDSLLGDAAGDYFGWSVLFSRDGTRLAIGAPRNSENGPGSGRVKVFARDEAALNFEQLGQSLHGRAGDDGFGFSMALSSEGKTLAVGARQFGTGEPGYVEVYEWDEATSGYKRLNQSLGGEASGDMFGSALAIAGDGGVLAVGAPDNDRNGTSSGRVEVFEVEL